MINDVFLPDQIHQWANTLLVWVGFGTLVGLFAKAIMPGRDPGGAVVTLAIGIAGTVIGCGTVAFFFQGKHVTPISLVGFLVSTGGAFILLGLYRLMAGYWFIEGGVPPRRPFFRRFYGARRYPTTEIIEQR